MKILVTGSAGFIGSQLCLSLLAQGNQVIGIDNHNNYYDVKLKQARLERHINHVDYQHYKLDLSDKNAIDSVFANHKPNIVVNLAAQAGVRYSMENPHAYINSNIVGFTNILEGCRFHKVNHLVYASTSSVYGANTTMPFSEHHNTNHPLSLYAASKKSNELMAHTYSYLFKLPTTGLRFFTVYGPWGRPDMALFKFTKNIIEDKPIDVFNHGNHTRDFTYIDDIVKGVCRTLNKPPFPDPKWNSDKPDPASSNVPWKIYNIGNNNPVKLMEYIDAIEKTLNKKAIINFLPLQPGDVPDTYSNTGNLVNEFNYKPNTTVNTGVKKFVDWYRKYYNL